MKLCKPAVVVEATRQLGYPESDIVGIGVLLLTCSPAVPLSANIVEQYRQAAKDAARPNEFFSRSSDRLSQRSPRKGLRG